MRALMPTTDVEKEVALYHSPDIERCKQYSQKSLLQKIKCSLFLKMGEGSLTYSHPTADGMLSIHAVLSFITSFKSRLNTAFSFTPYNNNKLFSSSKCHICAIKSSTFSLPPPLSVDSTSAAPSLQLWRKWGRRNQTASHPEGPELKDNQSIYILTPVLQLSCTHLSNVFFHPF